jgi:pyruvate/2-oxoglutarate dehydrogenase complex dihydrolipoamide acyltransferase (E2) component
LPHDVIMPALGMNQNTGKILSWLKIKGDTVNVGDPLMEVETDKAVVEVEAQANGILTEVRHAAGSEVPVGHVIAVIGGGAAAPAPIKDATAAANPAPVEQAKVAETERLSLTQQKAAPDEQSPKGRGTAPQATNRLLISPKARKEAARRGIDLSQLPKLAKSAPYHVADLDLIQREIASPAPAGVAANMMEFGATIDVEPTLSLADWIGKEIGKAIALDVVWAAFARGSLGGGTRRIRIRSLRGSQDYVVAPYQGLSQIVPAPDASDAIDLIIHDLSGSRLSRARVGSDRAPSLVLAVDPSTSKMALTLHADEAQLSPSVAMQFLDSFARRVESPIRAIL